MGFLMLLTTMLLPQIAGVALADPAIDRSFFVRWADLGNDQYFFSMQLSGCPAVPRRPGCPAFPDHPTGANVGKMHTPESLDGPLF
jgi:hypothetical protein